MKRFCKVLILILFPFRAFSQTPDNSELKRMYEDDQTARMNPAADWLQITREDSLREKRVYELINERKIITGKDYYHSAMIFQHGEDSVAYGMAVKHMRKAIELDSTINKWLLAAAIDRELMSRGKPQIYGTQYIKESGDDKWKRYIIDTTQVTDEERKAYGVKTLAEQVERERVINLWPLADYYHKTQSTEKTIALIRTEKKKGTASQYNVTEEEINRLGYILITANKIPEAEVVFRLNTELYPNRFNTYDSLGECMLLLGRKKEALEAYQKSLELNPKNENARKVLAEQREKN